MLSEIVMPLRVLLYEDTGRPGTECAYINQLYNDKVMKNLTVGSRDHSRTFPTEIGLRLL